MFRWLSQKTVGEILVLLVAFTVCGWVFLIGWGIVILSFVDPGFDTTRAAEHVGDIIQTLIGLLAGFLAGRTDAVVIRKRHLPVEEDTPPEES